MELSPVEFYKYKPKRRPYPFDLERKQNVERVMYQHGYKTLDDLSKAVNISKTVLCEVINGTRLSAKTEKRIAQFFGMRREELFPPRTLAELAIMNKAQMKVAD